jgi:hypothetical protein
MVIGSLVNITTYGSVPGSSVIVEPSLHIIGPDTDSTHTPYVDGRKLTYAFNPATAGIYNLTWGAGYTDGVFAETSHLPVTYLDIRGLMLSELRMKDANIDTRLFDQMLSGQMLYWLGMLVDDIPDYGNHPNKSDVIIFDTVMSMIMSCYMRPYVGFSMGTKGELAAIGTGPDRIEFHRKYSQISLEDSEREILDRAWIMLRVIKSVSDADYQQANDEPFFVAAGQRRALRTKLGQNDIQNPLYSIRSDQLLDYMFTGGYLNGLAY